ncbi:MAG: C40 family peptidase [Eubacteriaceae bacterium]
MTKIKKVMVVLIFIMIIFTSTASADYYSEGKLLYYGMYNSDVQDLQSDLKDLGYFHFYKTTKYFGSITYNAVVSYQKDKGLVVDGIVGPQTSRQIKRDKILKTAKEQMGVPYVWGGTSPAGFDCSGYTYYVLHKNGITIPRTAAEQYYVGNWVNKSNLIPGDLVFFTTYKSGPSHVGFYVGNNKFIHASSSNGIIISDLNNTYWSPRYIGAKRIIK